MPKFVALFIGAADPNTKPSLSEGEREAFMKAWARWSQDYQASIIDGGMPLGPTLRVTETGRTSVRNSVVAYCVVEAADHNAAASMFADHPHVQLISGNSIEVIAGLDLPT